MLNGFKPGINVIQVEKNQIEQMILKLKYQDTY